MMRATPWICALALAGCNPSGSTTVTADVRPPLNQPFTLEVGQAAVFFEPALVIRFAAVADSRCPTNVYCIWEGDGVASLVLHVGPGMGDGPDHSVELHTNLQPHSTPWGPSYEIRLISLDPYPVFDHPQGPYRATLIVESH
jgi:hypothetical protein